MLFPLHTLSPSGPCRASGLILPPQLAWRRSAGGKPAWRDSRPWRTSPCLSVSARPVSPCSCPSRAGTFPLCSFSSSRPSLRAAPASPPASMSAASVPAAQS
eukprot:scaffold23606_cov108-Isochrysis_galbana.AAC.8